MLPLVLVLILIAAAFCAAALDEAFTNRAISALRLAQQRAFVASASGVNLATAQLQQARIGGTHDYPLRSPDRVSVEVRATLHNPLPPGFSAGRFAEQHYELHSTGRSARGARSLQVQGLRRVEPQDGMTTPESVP